MELFTIYSHYLLVFSKEASNSYINQVFHIHLIVIFLIPNKVKLFLDNIKFYMQISFLNDCILLRTDIYSIINMALRFGLTPNLS